MNKLGQVIIYEGSSMQKVHQTSPRKKINIKFHIFPCGKNFGDIGNCSIVCEGKSGTPLYALQKISSDESTIAPDWRRLGSQHQQLNNWCRDNCRQVAFYHLIFGHEVWFQASCLYFPGFYSGRKVSFVGWLKMTLLSRKKMGTHGFISGKIP